MSILKVANIHFEAAGTKRIDYLNDDVLRISFGETVLSGNARFNGNGATKLSVGTTAQRPTGESGLIRFNTQVGSFEGYNGTAWANIVSGIIDLTPANNYSREVGAASNTWANNRASVSNTYAIEVGAAANNWANNRASVSNTYAIEVGVSSNAWTNTVFGFANSKFLANTTTTFNGTLTVTGTVSAAGFSGPGFFPLGTAMIFAQTTAPTGWTKSTTHNDKALRVVSGTASSGGSVAFTTAFASKAVSGTVGSTTLSVNQIPSHSHVQQKMSTGSASGSIWGQSLNNDQTPATANISTQNTGGGQSHDHSFTGTAIDMAVQYVDVIIATKD